MREAARSHHVDEEQASSAQITVYKSSERRMSKDRVTKFFGNALLISHLAYVTIKGVDQKGTGSDSGEMDFGCEV